MSDLLTDERYAYGFLISTISIGLIHATVDEKLKVKCSKTMFERDAIVNKLQEKAQRYGQDFLDLINTANRYFDEEEMIIELKSSRLFPLPYLFQKNQYKCNYSAIMNVE